jgi:hypothetical protein
MSISLHDNSVLLNGTDTIERHSNEVTQFVGTTSLRIPVGTSAQRPSSPISGVIRYNTDTTAMEYYNGSDWKVVGANDGSSAALAADSAVYLRDVVGETSDGTYWINVDGTPTEIYCIFSKNGGGWMSFASADTNSEWFPGNAGGNSADWRGLNYSYGTYSKTGAIGEYWRNIQGHYPGISEVMFITGNRSYWMSFEMKAIADAAAVGTSGTYYENLSGYNYQNSGFPDNSKSANTRFTIIHRNPNQGEDPWINAGNEHGSTTGLFMFWGENGSESHAGFRTSNGGILALVR